MLFPTMIFAQTTTNVQLTPADCQAAADSLTGGSRNVETWGYIQSCGGHGATAIAAAIRNAHGVSDTSYLADLLPSAGLVQHPNVLSEARALAEDNSAPIAARQFGLLIALRQIMPAASLESGGWQRLITVPKGQDCQLDYLSGTDHEYSSVMPSDYQQATADMADRVALDPNSPVVVRDLARCVRSALLPLVPRSAVSSQLRLDYVCGNEFRLSSSAPWPLTLQYEAVGTGQLGDISVRANGAVVFRVRDSVPVRILQRGLELTKASNGATSCP